MKKWEKRRHARTFAHIIPPIACGFFLSGRKEQLPSAVCENQYENRCPIYSLYGIPRSDSIINPHQVLLFAFSLKCDKCVCEF